MPSQQQKERQGFATAQQGANGDRLRTTEYQKAAYGILGMKCWAANIRRTEKYSF